jgi:hypothetical protein
MTESEPATAPQSETAVCPLVHAERAALAADLADQASTPSAG